MDGQVYSEANITDNWTKLVVACAIMARANEESVTKSKRAHAFRESFLRKPRRRFFSSALLFALAFVAFGSSRGPIASAQVNVTTQHNDIGRTGQNLNQTILNTSNVNTTQFGKLFAQVVDGTIYTQPLYLSNIAINGVTHNVVFVATMRDSVYAFDADSNNGANMNTLWQASMLSTTHGAPAGATTITGIAITENSVIDPISNTLYLVSGTYEDTQQVYRLHALDVTTGAEKFGGPRVITGGVTGTAPGNVGGTVTFYPSIQNQRPGLLLLINCLHWLRVARRRRSLARVDTRLRCPHSRTDRGILHHAQRQWRRSMDVGCGLGGGPARSRKSSLWKNVRRHC